MIAAWWQVLALGALGGAMVWLLWLASDWLHDSRELASDADTDDELTGVPLPDVTTDNPDPDDAPLVELAEQRRSELPWRKPLKWIANDATNMVHRVTCEVAGNAGDTIYPITVWTESAAEHWAAFGDYLACPECNPFTPPTDPTHGRIDPDIQETVNAMNPTSLGQRVAIENTLQERRSIYVRVGTGASGVVDPVPEKADGANAWVNRPEDYPEAPAQAHPHPDEVATQ